MYKTVQINYCINIGVSIRVRGLHLVSKLISDGKTCVTRGWASSMGKLRSDFCRLHFGQFTGGSSEMFVACVQVTRG